MFIHLNKSSARPLWLQIVDDIIKKISWGEIAPGYKLPPTRQLAQELGISRSTAQLAYDELASRGYIETYGKGGTIVKDIKQASNIDDQQSITNFQVIQENIHYSTLIDELDTWLKINDAEQMEIDFRHQEPYIDDQFHDIWCKTFNKACKNFDLTAWSYSSPYGLEETRLEIKKYLSVSRGINVDLEQIMLVSGSQQGIDLIAQTLLNVGDRAAIEDPGFPGARLTLMSRGVNIIGIPIDQEGIMVDHIPNKSRLIFVTPSHQRPTGVVLSVQRRQQLIDFSLANQTWILEDDFDGEFRYRGGPLPSLFSENQSNVLFLLSLSKVIAPGIRLAAIIGNREVIKHLSKRQSLMNRQLPIMEQITLGEYMRSGQFEKHIRRMRKIYRDRQQTMIHSLKSQNLEKKFKIWGADTGLHIFLEADRQFDEIHAVQLAAQNGVGIYPLKPYCYTSDRKGLLLGFARTDEEKIAEGIRRVSSIFC